MTFKNDHIVIVSASEGVIGTHGTNSTRGRELAERQYRSVCNKLTNCSDRARVFYVTLTGDIVPLKWVRGNLNDVFLDNKMLPERARIPKVYRQETDVL